MLPVILFSVSLLIYWHVTSCVIQCIIIYLLACYQLFYSVYHEIMAEIDNMNMPDRIIRPIAHKMPNMANLQIPPVLNEPIPMKPFKKATPVIDYDQILAPS